ncbi:MAG: TlpA disulfide reductase family protein [Bacteroidales bacterium]|jgi:peroxiredoxin|nr:TlpA disulfide reductase family protein [Bacteroidales bacterium]MDD2686967.1 TlpA disulfide reductase family protein [Bacteroidales bacterium]MDD3330110.1 TlpA disulfide reductase family protein [Bacteroidales bacterium]MDD3690879.1 TlpA disulfide reductase family protein [Bacteroidales bacterium]MDD4580921.1 TlpA disulfide reductase family protein [Bacteroidales bacterium]
MKKKIIIHIFIFSLLSFSSLHEIAAQHKKTSLKGTVINYISTDSIGLYDALGRVKTAIEKASVDKKGGFEFKYNPQEIGFYTLHLPEAKNILIVMIPNTTVDMNIDANQGIITKTSGSKENDLLKIYYTHLSEATHIKDSLTKLYQSNPSPQITEELQALDQRWVAQLKELCLQNATNFTSSFLIENLPMEQYFDIHDSVVSSLIKKYPDNFFIKSKYDQISSTKKTALNSVAPEIALPDTSGNIVRLSSLRGKIILIDFWASWCGPCRRESPNMVKLYETYRDQGFEIYAVSLDQSRDNWISAIESDGLTWIHVSDLKRWQCQAGIDYGIRSIPSTVLLDEEGRIIAKDLRGEALAAKVKEMIEKRK